MTGAEMGLTSLNSSSGRPIRRKLGSSGAPPEPIPAPIHAAATHRIARVVVGSMGQCACESVMARYLHVQ